MFVKWKATLVLVTNLRSFFEFLRRWPYGLIVSPLRRRVRLLSGKSRLRQFVIPGPWCITVTSNVGFGLKLLLALVAEGQVIAIWIGLEPACNSCCRIAGPSVKRNRLSVRSLKIKQTTGTYLI